MLLRQVSASTWAGYDNRVEALLGMGAAGVVESLLRTAARMPSQPEAVLVMKAQVHRSAGGSSMLTMYES